MNLKNLSDDHLLLQTENLVQAERKLLVDLLHHLREIERRRLFSKLGFSSLFQYAVTKLGYPEDQAHRRIVAMRLLKELPELEEKVADGALSLTGLGMAKTLFRKEKKAGREMSREAKLDLLAHIENKPVREVARVMTSISPESMANDRLRPIRTGHIEITFTCSETLEAKISQLKGLLAHKYPDLTLGELFEKLADLGLKEWSKPLAPPRDLKRQESQAGVRRAVFTRDKVCVNCGSIHALELDHITPRAKGGDSSYENLRVLCRNCNQRAAIEQFGISKMESYLRSQNLLYHV